MTGGVREDSFAENISLFLFVVRFVVTAAHCVSEGGISITVTLGKKIYIYKHSIFKYLYDITTLLIESLLLMLGHHDIELCNCIIPSQLKKK